MLLLHRLYKSHAQQSLSMLQTSGGRATFEPPGVCISDQQSGLLHPEQASMARYAAGVAVFACVPSKSGDLVPILLRGFYIVGVLLLMLCAAKLFPYEKQHRCTMFLSLLTDVSPVLYLARLHLLLQTLHQSEFFVLLFVYNALLVM